MSSYKNQELFSSGPHAFRVHGLSQRYQAIESPGVDGARIVPLGRTARAIDQAGVLYGENVWDLQQRLDAIESAMDGKGGTLVDELNRSWVRMVFTEFNPARLRREGVRWSINYTARYVQTQPDPVAPPPPA